MLNSHQIDESLFAAIKNSDYISYNTLFNRYYARLCQYVYGFLLDKEDAEDVVQEVFLNIWNNRASIRITESVSGYLYKAAKHQVLNHLRTKSNYKKLLENQSDSSLFYEQDEMEVAEFRATLYACIDQLPPRSREVLLLHRVDGLKQKEIAEKLNTTTKTIKNQIWSSLKKLKVCLTMKGIQFF